MCVKKYTFMFILQSSSRLGCLVIIKQPETYKMLCYTNELQMALQQQIIILLQQIFDLQSSQEISFERE